ncbi:NADH-quinone oxidoreductase subunit M [Desulfacinum hydrothermale DSM 13146]|uniref:NADH-quinone oxidoreductase subunit M n=1 Tax=Desulfacinum hydrothermale DSM 13146 TaxID=1121390 RepID=A0A1W1X8P1_9BACT|nr:NADH-quinone oxidoreductase subunit M [Desulfacinum hydrothermale]SMC20332.1 NADH-quinone oxidoreductase subunit M [Desulfacinum hydrothermale DSM 13146]
MDNVFFPILTAMVFTPLLGAAILVFVDRENPTLQRWVTLLAMAAVFVFALIVYGGFDPTRTGMQYEEWAPWVPALGISYHLGVDGISLLLVALTAFLGPICVLACWRDIQEHVKEFLVCLLLLQTGMLGVFLALDLVLFYLFWEVMLIPMALLILVWGHPARRVYAAVKFFLYTMAGSVFMLVGILVLYFYQAKTTGTYSFDLMDFMALRLPFRLQLWLFAAFGIAFAIKVPMFPFHTWLPDAHTEAPTVGSVVLAAVLLKMGTYGFLRFNLSLFPEASIFFAPLMVVLALAGIVYGAFMCLVQKDLKRLIAYSSVSHLGFVMLGLFTFTLQGLQGSLIQMINHGLSTGALFLLVGMIYERRHTRMIADFGGLSTPVPRLAVFFMIATLASIGLPGLNGFVGEFLILLGTFKVKPLWAAVGATGVILAAWYMLWMVQRVFFGQVQSDENRLMADLVPREVALLVPVVACMVWIGVAPTPFLKKSEPAVGRVLARVQRVQHTAHLNSTWNPECLVSWYLADRK